MLHVSPVPCLGFKFNNNKINNKEIGREDVDWFHLAQERIQRQALVNTAMNVHVP
jgi:hypothetical protein